MLQRCLVPAILCSAGLSAAEPPAPGAGAAGMPAPTAAKPAEAAAAAVRPWTAAEAATWAARIQAAGGVPAQTYLVVTGEKQRISAEAPKSYMSKTRLKAMKHLAPGSLDPASLVVSKGGTVYAVGKDLLLDAVWGGLGIAPGSALTPQDEVEISYRLALRRLDALVRLPDGREIVRPGEPELLIPRLPAIAAGETLLATIFVDYHADPAKPQVLPVLEPATQARLATTGPDRLPATVAKLRSGQPVTIVCWGDSVTEGGDLKASERYGDQLAARLKTAAPNATVQIIAVGGSNSGQWLLEPGQTGGHPSRQAECRFQRILDAKPDLVAIEFVNDQWMSAADTRKRYGDIIARLRAIGAEVVLVTPQRNWEQGKTDFRTADPRQLVAVLRGLGHEGGPGVGVADMAGRWEHLWLEGIPFPALLANGFNHPDVRGHRLFHEEVCRALGIDP